MAEEGLSAAQCHDGQPVMGKATAADPTYIEGALHRLSLTLTGALRVAMAAGSAIIGKVGIDQTTPGTTDRVTIGDTGVVRVSPTVSASPNYDIDDVLGGKMTLTNAARVAAFGEILNSVVMTSKVDIPTGVTVDILFFDTDPTNSTFTDNAVLAVNTADLPFMLPGVAQLSTRVDLGTPAALMATNLGIPMKPTTGRDLFAVAVVRGAATLDLASVSDIQFVFGFLRD